MESMIFQTEKEIPFVISQLDFPQIACIVRSRNSSTLSDVETIRGRAIMLKSLKRWFAKKPSMPNHPELFRHTENLSHEISPIQVKQKIEDGVARILVDVRNPDEYGKAIIQGALQIPRDDIYARYNEISDDPSAEIIVFCHHGIESEQVMHQLWGLGFQNAKVMSGGIDAWSVEVDPKIPRY